MRSVNIAMWMLCCSAVACGGTIQEGRAVGRATESLPVLETGDAVLCDVSTANIPTGMNDFAAIVVDADQEQAAFLETGPMGSATTKLFQSVDRNIAFLGDGFLSAAEEYQGSFATMLDLADGLEASVVDDYNGQRSVLQCRLASAEERAVLRVRLALESYADTIMGLACDHCEELSTIILSEESTVAYDNLVGDIDSDAETADAELNAALEYEFLLELGLTSECADLSEEYVEALADARQQLISELVASSLMDDVMITYESTANAVSEQDLTDLALRPHLTSLSVSVGGTRLIMQAFSNDEI